MRILTSGLEEKRAQPFWTQQPITCSACSCMFEMGSEDPVDVSENIAFFNCPHCEASLMMLGKDPPTLLSNELRREQASHDETVAQLNEALVRISDLENQLHELSTNN